MINTYNYLEKRTWQEYMERHRAGENLSGNINFYTMYVSGIDITATGSVADQTQQNFDDVCNVINLVAQPIIMNNPIAVTLNGLAPSLTGPVFF